MLQFNNIVTIGISMIIKPKRYAVLITLSPQIIQRVNDIIQECNLPRKVMAKKMGISQQSLYNYFINKVVNYCRPDTFAHIENFIKKYDAMKALKKQQEGQDGNKWLM